MNYQNNPKGRQMFISDELKINPSLSFSNMFSKCIEIFRMSQDTFNKDWLKVNENINKEIKQLSEINKVR